MVTADTQAALAALTATYTSTLSFYLNAQRVSLEVPDPTITLLEYIRSTGLTGTKLGCAEGGCGACTVLVQSWEDGKVVSKSVNACIAPLISVDGKHVVTVEGIGNSTAPHPVQERIAIMHGSQCGFCTPGIVMSLYALLQQNPEPTEAEVEECWDGNLCRCTGYRPILDAGKTFATGCGRAGGCCRDKKKADANGIGNGSGDSTPVKNDKVDGNGLLDGEVDFTSKPKKAPATSPSPSDKTNCCRTTPSNPKQPPPSTPAFALYEPSKDLAFPAKLMNFTPSALAFGTPTRRWLRPTSLDELLKIKAICPSAKVVGGSSEVQIEAKFKGVNFAVSVYTGDISELRTAEFAEEGLVVGANITLSSLEGVLDEACEHFGEKGSAPYRALLKTLRGFAGRQIRNVATPAGNIATASPISDLNPVLMATGSKLVMESVNGGTSECYIRDFFKGYRSTALEPEAVITKLVIPASKEREWVQSYKQAKRKDDDIAIVNAGMRVRLGGGNVVEEIDLCYGGMAPTTVAAKKTMAFLKGKVWGEKDVLEGAMKSLEEDFNLPFGVPGGMPIYRKSLAFSFFFKFWSEVTTAMTGTAVEDDDLPHAEITRNISAGWRDEETPNDGNNAIVGKPLPHVAALKQVTGEAQYIDDLPRFSNELYGCLVLSTKAHAKVVRVDTDAALDMPGVAGYVDHTDLPSPEANWWGAPRCDEVFFAVDEVFCAGQPIGFILADTKAHAQAAARAVVVEYEELPAIFTMEEAIAQDSFFPHYRFIKRDGDDMDGAFAKADHVFEGVARMGGQEHFYLETNAAMAVWKPEDGEMDVYSSTQNPTETQTYAAKVTGVPANRVVCKVKRMGGGFGGKETRSVQLSSICAIAAKKMKRPVRCMLDRDEDMATSGQRHPFLSKWKVGVNNDGKLVALDADVFCNGGWTQDLSGAIVERALSHIDNVYYIPHVNVRGRVCKTNIHSNTAFRGFGGPQGMFICESYMSEIADQLNMSVDRLREINFYKEGQKTHFNQVLEDFHVPQIYEQIKVEADYDERRKAVDEFNKTHRWRKRGLALIPTKFGISFTALFLNQAGALVHIYHDGSILLAHGGTEMGQGLHTKMCMVAAEELGVPLENVHISETATNTVANTSSTAASASSDLNGMAIKNACDQINERLKPYREKLGPDATMKQLATAAYFDRVNLSANGFYKTPTVGYEWGNENSKPMFFYFTQGAAIAEVEIDTLTGDWKCERADVKMDIGRTINQAIDYGQIEGAFVQGMGLFTMEESLWLRHNGNLFTKGPGAYKIPGFRDVPVSFNLSMLKGVPWKNLRTIQRSKGVGEPPLFMGSAVFFAMRDAIKSARKDAGNTGLLALYSPATPERIRLACTDEITERAHVNAKEKEHNWFIQP
ncbi:hypothetical protein YB2330_000279 [Saitoella coloradoensis]